MSDLFFPTILPPLQDCTLKRNELKALRTLIEREALEKHKLEDSVMEKILSQLTMDKATQHTKRTVEKMRLRVKQLVCTYFLDVLYLHMNVGVL